MTVTRNKTQTSCANNAHVYFCSVIGVSLLHTDSQRGR